jgi:hypothetical protein
MKKWTKKKRLLRKAISKEKTSIKKINQIRGNNETHHVANGVLKT